MHTPSTENIFFIFAEVASCLGILLAAEVSSVFYYLQFLFNAGPAWIVHASATPRLDFSNMFT